MRYWTFALTASLILAWTPSRADDRPSYRLYDENGQRAGGAAPFLSDSYKLYDSTGRRTGTATETFTDNYVIRDNSGRRIGTVDTYSGAIRDQSGRRVGSVYGR